MFFSLIFLMFFDDFSFSFFIFFLFYFAFHPSSILEKKIIFFVFLVPIPLQPRTLDFSFFCLFFVCLNTRTRTIFTYLWVPQIDGDSHLSAAYLHDFDFNYSRRVCRQCSFQTYPCGSCCTHYTS